MTKKQEPEEEPEDRQKMLLFGFFMEVQDLYVDQKATVDGIRQVLLKYRKLILEDDKS